MLYYNSPTTLRARTARGTFSRKLTCTAVSILVVPCLMYAASSSTLVAARGNQYTSTEAVTHIHAVQQHQYQPSHSLENIFKTGIYSRTNPALFCQLLMFIV